MKCLGTVDFPGRTKKVGPASNAHVRKIMFIPCSRVKVKLTMTWVQAGEILPLFHAVGGAIRLTHSDSAIGPRACCWILAWAG